ncbi:MAG: hypothetical protein MSH60_12325, partial [Ruminococcus sp.]|nr:hypothetical protein [Ruminococcus sp.]
GVIDNSEGSFTEGGNVTLKLSSSSVPFNAVIERITAGNDPKKSVVIISCENLTFDVVQHRVERAEMVLNDFYGLKVPAEAIRFNRENEKGVYVKLGQKITFKKIDVVFTGDDYVLSRITQDSSYLAVYEDIIVEGVNTNEFLETEDDINGTVGGKSESLQSESGTTAAS